MAPLVLGFPPITGMINPLWSSLFGFPFSIAAAGHPVYGPHPWYEGIAFLAWPLVLIGLMIWAALRLVLSRHRWRNFAVVGWAISAFFLVPIADAYEYFGSWPLWLPD